MTGLKKNNPDARFSRLYFCHRLNRLQRGLSAIAELRVLNLNRYVDAQNSIAALHTITSSTSSSASRPKIGTSDKIKSCRCVN